MSDACDVYACVQEYTPEDAYGGNIAMQGMSELAQQLLADACQGTDPPLPMPLPHTRQLSLLGNSSESPAFTLTPVSTVVWCAKGVCAIAM